MATSSITHNFVIRDRKSARKFINILTSPVVQKSPSVKYNLVKNLDDSSLLSELKKRYGTK